jgi:hypothetical protein
MAVRLYRDIVVPVLKFVEFRECPGVARVCRCFLEAARFGGFPQFKGMKIPGWHLVKFAESSLKFPNLVCLTVFDLHQGYLHSPIRHPVPDRLNHASVRMLNLQGEGLDPDNLNRLLKMMVRIDALRICITESGRYPFYGSFQKGMLDVEAKAKIANLRTLAIGSVVMLSTVAMEFLGSDALEEVTLSCGKCSDELMDLLTSKPTLKRLGIVDEPRWESELDRGKLAQCTHLACLSLDPLVTAAQLCSILRANQNSLITLNLTHVSSDQITEPVLEAIGQLRLLEALALPRMDIDPEKMRHLGGCPKLRTLMFYQGVYPGYGTFRHFVQALPNLHALLIQQSRMEGSFFTALEALQSLRELYIEAHSPCTKAIATSIGKLSNLEKLNVEFSQETVHRTISHIEEAEVRIIITQCRKLVSLEVIGLRTFAILAEIEHLISTGQSRLQFFNAGNHWKIANISPPPPTRSFQFKPPADGMHSKWTPPNLNAFLQPS